VWEFKLQSKGVESLTRLVSEFELIGVLIEFKDLEDLGNNIEVVLLLGGFLEFANSVTTNIGALEETAGPLSEGGKNSSVLLLNGGSLSRESIWRVVGNGLSKWGLFVSREKSI